MLSVLSSSELGYISSVIFFISFFSSSLLIVISGEIGETKKQKYNKMLEVHRNSNDDTIIDVEKISTR